MANLDTAAKRLAGIAVSLPWRGVPGPATSGVSDIERQVAAFMPASPDVQPPPAVDDLLATSISTGAPFFTIPTLAGTSNLRPITLQVSGFDIMMEDGDFI